mmetsp:Transcript_15607/g.51232  ORF Transcript_15607/g.51232 Transcript_15607/m.51232 type:complete len:353 (+) Transcript_15607:578-1636(+)
MSTAERCLPCLATGVLFSKPTTLHSCGVRLSKSNPINARSTSCTRVFATAALSKETSPKLTPIADNRTSAFSGRTLSRRSTRDENIRYGSLAPRRVRSSTKTPMYELSLRSNARRDEAKVDSPSNSEVFEASEFFEAESAASKNLRPSSPCIATPAAAAPATTPCAAASSYPVVPFICPAKNNPLIFLVSSVTLNSRGSTKSYSTPYPGFKTFTFSKPGIVRSIASCVSGSREHESPFGYTTSVSIPSGSSHTRWDRPGNRLTLVSREGQYRGDGAEGTLEVLFLSYPPFVSPSPPLSSLPSALPPSVPPSPPSPPPASEPKISSNSTAAISCGDRGALATINSVSVVVRVA